MDERFEGFARNTLEYMREERDLLFGGAGLPELRHPLAGRHALVVVRGYGYREDLAALRSYIRDVKPVLVGVDGGADALLDAGYTPDVVIGDMDSISDRALELLNRPRRVPTDIVLHAYPDGRAPGRARLERLGIPHVEVRSAGTSEDVAFLLAHERRAELIVAVGTHGNLREFLDKGRPGDVLHVPRPAARRRDLDGREGGGPAVSEPGAWTRRRAAGRGRARRVSV